MPARFVYPIAGEAGHGLPILPLFKTSVYSFCTDSVIALPFRSQSLV
jgi:hypothetical protein